MGHFNAGVQRATSTRLHRRDRALDPGETIEAVVEEVAGRERQAVEVRDLLPLRLVDDLTLNMLDCVGIILNLGVALLAM